MEGRSENQLSARGDFLSNFRLILSTYMAIKLYGQCHFSICWETETGEDMAPEEWPHPNRG
jgi:hypothetical protein